MNKILLKKVIIIVLAVVLASAAVGAYLGIKSWRVNKKLNTYTETTERNDFDRLLAIVPFQNELFTVDYQDDHTFLITPVMNFNPSKEYAPQISRNWELYEKNVLAGITWIKSRNLDPKKIEITIWGQEWWPAGKIITY